MQSLGSIQAPGTPTTRATHLRRTLLHVKDTMQPLGHQGHQSLDGIRAIRTLGIQATYLPASIEGDPSQPGYHFTNYYQVN